MHAYYVGADAWGGQKMHQIIWNSRSRWLYGSMWVPGTTRWTAGAFSCFILSLTPYVLMLANMLDANTSRFWVSHLFKEFMYFNTRNLDLSVLHLLPVKFNMDCFACVMVHKAPLAIQKRSKIWSLAFGVLNLSYILAGYPLPVSFLVLFAE